VWSAALVAVQPNSRPSSKQAHRNAQLLSELLRRKEHLLRRQAMRHADGPDDVDDALQSAYALFLERFRGDCEPLAWLYTTVKREAWALRRRGWRQREVSATVQLSVGELDLCDATPGDAPDPLARLERRDQLAERMQALNTLKEDERRALWLIGLGLSYVEISKATGWTHTKINRCASEGRAALRRIGQLKS
jgi:RNA polymerase sigma factor (sigma-70 family)